ncbi:hypothetical protein ARMGADRAFT_365979 [Armillaria gallica]|uniref:Uncharacterized protein n=1 Tax=Armillaria gallica TaxID=47427 RepID=A0A2H3EJ48_ARMGA|nr:hypothetical protein ARMGADRAFT_365979 [Armillaria gallica]
MEGANGAENLPTNNRDTGSTASDSYQSPLAVNRTMENVPTTKEGASFEEERIECLNKIILENLPRARERDIRPRAFAIRLFGAIEDFIFEPSDDLADGPEDLYDLTERGRMDGNFGDLLKDR